tara:strand:- start:8805 stop:9431 length:627 start_codon:yes stop_codon:yes gene_type:complete
MVSCKLEIDTSCDFATPKECFIRASQKQMIRAFGFWGKLTEAGLIVPVPGVKEAVAGMTFSMYKKKYVPKAITVKHQIIFYPTCNDAATDRIVAWRCVYTQDYAFEWAKGTLALLAEQGGLLNGHGIGKPQQPKPRKKKGPTAVTVFYERGNRVTKLKRNAKKSALERWEARAAKQYNRLHPKDGSTPSAKVVKYAHVLIKKADMKKA